MDAADTPGGAFDLIGAFDVLEHIEDDEAVIRSMRRALVPGGGAIFAVPQHPSLWNQQDEMACHVRRYQTGELQEKLTRNGFEILFTSSYNAVLLPLMAASRSLRLTRDEVDNGAELTIGPLANRLLTACLRAEVRLTLAGMRWPLGGSRFVVARALSIPPAPVSPTSRQDAENCGGIREAEPAAYLR